MSTNKTQHLNLHQWRPDDDFLREEFNENFSILDSASVSTSLVKGNLTGTGVYPRTIEVGFRPSLLIFFHRMNTVDSKLIILPDGCYGAFGGVFRERPEEEISFTNTGFILHDGSSTNENGRKASYVAFR